MPELLAAVRHACQAFPAQTALYAELAGSVVALVPLRSGDSSTPAARLAEAVIGGTVGCPDSLPAQFRGLDTGSAARAYSESIRALRIPLADPLQPRSVPGITRAPFGR